MTSVKILRLGVTAPFLLMLVLLMTGCAQEEEKTGPLIATDLVGTEWQLVEMRYGEIVDEEWQPKVVMLEPDTVVTLKFQDNLLGGESFCSNFRVNWQADEFDRLITTGEVAQTRTNCPDRHAAVEERFINLIDSVIHAEMSNGRLVFKSPQHGEAFFERK